MDSDEKFYTIKAMQQFGGGFVSALAAALSRADAQNTARIVAAFPDYIKEYGPKSKFYRVVKAAE